ncbi:hypothetical protein [Acrocarpospora phusangensis]
MSPRGGRAQQRLADEEPRAPHVVSDRNLRTGQNPASSAALAVGLLKALA